MFPRGARWWSVALGLALAVGCCYRAHEQIDSIVCDLAAQPRDLQPLTAAGDPGTKATARAADSAYADVDAQVVALAAFPNKGPTGGGGTPPGDGPAAGGAGQPAGGDQPPGDTAELKPISPQFQIPPELLPRGPVAPIEIPRGATRAEKLAIYSRAHPPLGPLGEDPQPVPGPEGRPLTLSDLQRLALSNSPQLKEAAATVKAMKGAALQAGLPPNPSIGLEVDTFGTTGGAGYVGGFVDQVIKTANKLRLARAAASMDLKNAELALRRAETDLMTGVRAGYFQVLVARENMRISKALALFAERVYTAHVEQLRKGGLAAAYEPLYLRVLAVQARAGLVQARNRYTSAWKQLAAAMGVPGMPPTQLLGRIDIPIPVFDHQEVLARVLARHTDVLVAENAILQARYRLELAQVTPIPDVELRVLAQRDYTGPPFEVAGSLQVTVPIPVWDRNQGGILQAESNVVQQSEEPHRVRGALSTTLADAFERYQNSRILLEYYRNDILPNQVRIYQGVYKRWNQDPTSGLNFTDISVAQQGLATAVTTYLTTLGQLWQSVVDITNLLQTNDMFQVGGKPVPTECVPPPPELGDLPALPCCHPCSPVPDLHQRLDRVGWPQAIPPETVPRESPAQREKTPPAKKPSGDRPKAPASDLPAPRRVPGPPADGPRLPDLAPAETWPEGAGGP